MNVSLLPENIIKFLPLINKVIPSHSQIPILSNVLLIASEEGFFIQSTDLDFGVKVKIPAKIEEEGGVTVPGREFLEAINNLPKEKVKIMDEKDKLRVECLDNKLSFSTINMEEFPQLYKEKGEKITTIPRKEFDDTFSNIMFSISLEETRPQLTGVYVDPKEDGVNFVTTDGYRMSIKKANKGKMNKGGGLIIPSKLINEASSLKEGDVDIYIGEKENQIIFEVGEALLVGRMIEGKFPDYEKVVPKKAETTITFEREGLLQKARLISVFAKNNSNITTLTIKNGEMSLATRSHGVGDGEAVLDCLQKGEDARISLNIKYLNDVLKAGTDKEMSLKINSPTEPAVFENEKGDFIHVIMPVQVEA